MRSDPSRDCHQGITFLVDRVRVVHLTQTLNRQKQFTLLFQLLDCIDSFGASESLLLRSESFAFESCPANSFANSALVSSMLGMRGLEPFLLIGIVQNNNNGSFWNFVLIRSEIDKGPFVG